MTTPKVGSIWEERIRVLGRSSVWDHLFVCELLTGPGAGRKVLREESDFTGESKSLLGELNSGIQLARRRRSE